MLSTHRSVKAPDPRSSGGRWPPIIIIIIIIMWTDRCMWGEAMTAGCTMGKRHAHGFQERNPVTRACIHRELMVFYPSTVLELNLFLQKNIFILILGIKFSTSSVNCFRYVHYCFADMYSGLILAFE